jgi:hypothetical protein
MILSTGRKPKVPNTWVTSFIDEYIVGFEVAMNYSVAVDVAKAFEYLPE